MKTIVSFFVLLAAQSSFGAPASVLLQVLADAQVARLTSGASIQKIEETAVYRCLGCYEFTITQRTPIGLQQIKVATKGTGADRVLVNVMSMTK